MSLVSVPDGDGHSIDLVEVDGYRICTFFQPVEVIGARFREIKNFRCHSDDVFVCAPVKSGTHWTWEIMSMMLLGKAETIPKNKTSNMLENTSHDTLGKLPTPRVLNSHVAYSYLPDQLKEKKCKVVYVLRNPKDMAVSFYHHVKGIQAYNYNGKWEHFLPMFLNGVLEYGDWFDYVREWESIIANNTDLPIHVIYYEDMQEVQIGNWVEPPTFRKPAERLSHLKNPDRLKPGVKNYMKEIYRLGEFLGVQNKDGLFENIAEKCMFKNMRASKAHTPEFVSKVYKNDFTMYRKGEVGDWKNHFTVAQNEMFDKVFEERMKDSTFKFRYTFSEAP